MEVSQIVLYEEAISLKDSTYKTMLSKYKIQQRMSLQTQPTVAGRRTPTPPSPPPPPSSAPPRSPGDISRSLAGFIHKMLFRHRR